MKAKDLRKDMKVLIAEDIGHTARTVSVNGEMRMLAGQLKPLNVNEVRFHDEYGTIASVEGYVWMPSDLINCEDGWTKEVAISGDVATFDPSEL